ncbi:MAG TPA: MurT ligase domain-containing protein [Mycobacteriales bacterium]|nr:MurT ligase domain-containing protein [Mycobacteriales bacterium]
MTARYSAARAAGSAVARLSRLTGRGGGTHVGGRVTLAIDPGALARAAAGRELALVSGTNGKTTTRTLLVAALGTVAPVVSNGGGANLPPGLTVALTADRASRLGVLEVDEPFLPRVIEAVRPRAVVLLNLSRDQLDRYAEVRRLAGIWRDALAAPDAPLAVANADDPLVVWAASTAREAVWVGAGQRWTFDSTSCPECGDVLVRADTGRGWRSPGCGLSRPEPGWTVDGRTVRTSDGTSYDVELSIPGDVNVGNAAMAAAAAGLWGVPPAAAFDAMAAIPSVEGRYLQTAYAGRQVRLLLAKNPAGWVEALEMSRPDAPTVVAVNARAADGRDPSWLWDVPFELLRGRQAVATGERSRDVAVRLRYAGVEHTRVDDPAQALRAAAGLAGPAADAPVEVLANYTAFQGYRAVVEDG